ncbi:hypothetical protein X975_01522, partial [Stegodyphus mimosarum]
MTDYVHQALYLNTIMGQHQCHFTSYIKVVKTILDNTVEFSCRSTYNKRKKNI